MDPLKGPRDGREVPPELEPKVVPEATDGFSRLMEPPKPLEQALDAHERETWQRVQDGPRRITPPPAPGLGTSLSQRDGGGQSDPQQRPSTPLPMPLQTPWMPVAEHRNPEGMLLPRRKPQAQGPDAQVDAPLLECLRQEGLLDPVVGLRDPRMTGDAPFAGAGWTRVLSETGLSATWRSTREPAGTWQACLLAEGRRLIETVADGTMQIIEERLGDVSVSRRPAPRFEADL